MANVCLGDVVARIKDKVDPSELTYYVGGEHFEYGSVTVDKKAPIQGSTIGPAFHIRFKPGDVLLMSRNPHLRKAGIVDFEGLCSDVSYVCRTKDENVLLQRYLPFIFQTDDFWKFGEANKKGSTNFFLNWSDFEKYEFSLPPLAEQKKLAETLWAMERVKRAYKNLLAETDRLTEARFVEMFGDPVKNEKGWPMTTVGKSAYVFAGNPFDSREYKDSGVRICGGLIIMPDRIAWEDCKYWASTEGVEKYQLELDDIVLAMDRPWIGGGFKIAKIREGDLPALLIQRTSCVRGRGADQEYLLACFKHKAFKEHCNITATTVPHISMGDITDYEIPLPPLALQREFAAFVAQAEKAKASLQSSLAALTAAQKSLMNQAFKNVEVNA